ncbi:MAG: hypothetical protein UCH28_07560 [Adlercreutzia sp.]|nr:hypothetical protein [Adlercreutzia sp.]
MYIIEKAVAIPKADEAIICCFRDNLEVIRKAASWTSQQLADEIGVTRQTNCNLEGGRTKMTKSQHLALRTVLSFETYQNENRILATAVKSLVDDQGLPEGYVPEGYETSFITGDSTAKRATQGNAIASFSILTAAAARSLGAIGIVSALSSAWKK